MGDVCYVCGEEAVGNCSECGQSVCSFHQVGYEEGLSTVLHCPACMLETESGGSLLTVSMIIVAAIVGAIVLLIALL